MKTWIAFIHSIYFLAFSARIAFGGDSKLPDGNPAMRMQRFAMPPVDIADQAFQPEMTVSEPLELNGHEDVHVRFLLENNRKWVLQRKKRDPEYFDKLGKGQKPKYLYYGCSDSRVPINEITGMGPDEIFVHRNVGNIITGNDLSAQCALEFAVDHLGVTDILVCGHYDCGAVKAAVTQQDLGTLEHWLRSIRDVHRLHDTYLRSCREGPERHRELVRLNVEEQCFNLFKTGVVQRKRLKVREKLLREAVDRAIDAGATSMTTEQLSAEVREEIEKNVYPRVHGMIFDPADGYLRKLSIDFIARMTALGHIYSLYK